MITFQYVSYNIWADYAAIFVCLMITLILKQKYPEKFKTKDIITSLSIVLIAVSLINPAELMLVYFPFWAAVTVLQIRYIEKAKNSTWCYVTLGSFGVKPLVIIALGLMNGSYSLVFRPEILLLGN